MPLLPPLLVLLLALMLLLLVLLLLLPLLPLLLLLPPMLLLLMPFVRLLAGSRRPLIERRSSEPLAGAAGASSFSSRVLSGAA